MKHLIFILSISFLFPQAKANNDIVIAQVAGAVGDMAVNSGTLSPNSQKIINYYNLAMGVIGIKNVGKGIVNYAKNLNPDVLNVLKNNESIKGELTTAYTEWKNNINDLGELSTDEQKLVNQQNNIWKALGVADEDLEALKGGNTIDNIANISKIESLTPRIPAGQNLTNLSKADFVTYGYKVKPLSGELKTAVDDIIANGDNLGAKTEAIVDKIMTDNGYTVLDGKYGSNNGYDGIYIKGTIDNPTEIIIIESKQFKYANNAATGLTEFNGVSLNPPSATTPLPAQMSDDWIKYVANKLSLNSSTSNLGDKITELMENNRSIIKKYVSAVDKTTGEINLLKLGEY